MWDVNHFMSEQIASMHHHRVKPPPPDVRVFFGSVYLHSVKFIIYGVKCSDQPSILILNRCRTHRYFAEQTRRRWFANRRCVKRRVDRAQSCVFAEEMPHDRHNEQLQAPAA